MRQSMKTKGHADLFLPPKNPKLSLLSRLRDKFDWLITLVEIPDNITRLVIFYFLILRPLGIWHLRITYNYSNAVTIGIQLPEGEAIKTWYLFLFYFKFILIF